MIRKKLNPFVFVSRILPVVLLIFSVIQGQNNADITGKVTRIFDGDTLEITDSSNTRYRVRLQGIDAPERGQPFSTKSRSVLSDLVFGKEVMIIAEGKDQYERYLGHVYIEGKWINREMIRRGLAWHYKYFNKDYRLAHSEIYARYSRLGLWTDPKSTAPWIFRRNNSEKGKSDLNRDPTEFWLNTSTGVRHNKTCKHFMKTSKGRFCGPNEGRPCGECGG